jgi:hypothetical protein
MHATRVVMVVAFAAALASCDGGSDSSNAGNGTAYGFVTPVMGSQRGYSETIVDNDNNTIDLSYTQAVTAVNADGSYTVVQQDPIHKSVVVDGTTYSIQTQLIDLDNSGQATSYTYADAGADNVICIYTPNGPGPNFPVMIGATWTLDYTFGCGTQAAVSYVQIGTVADVESVTVPAGTFNAIKLQSTITWTDAQGTMRTQTVTNWRDVLTSISVKQSITITYAGTPLTGGYPVSREIVLQSLLQPNGP